MLKIWFGMILDQFGIFYLIVKGRMTSLKYQNYQVSCLVFNNIGRILVTFRIWKEIKRRNIDLNIFGYLF